MGEPVVNETMRSVQEWADQTFGPASVGTQIHRASKEMEELLWALTHNEPEEKIAFEAADVVIVLYRLIAQLNPEAINQKMAINRARQWHVGKDGVGQHIKQGGGL
jgi:hypothetical protein